MNYRKSDVHHCSQEHEHVALQELRQPEPGNLMLQLRRFSKYPGRPGFFEVRLPERERHQQWSRDQPTSRERPVLRDGIRS